MSRADRIEIGCSALLAVAEPLGAVCVHDMSDDDLLSLASALERVDDGLDSVQAIVQTEIDLRGLEAE